MTRLITAVAAAVLAAIAIHQVRAARTTRQDRQRLDAIIDLLAEHPDGLTQQQIGDPLGYPYLDPRLAEDLLTLADAGRIQRGHQTSPDEPSLRRTCWRLADPARTAGRRVTP